MFSKIHIINVKGTKHIPILNEEIRNASFIGTVNPIIEIIKVNTIGINITIVIMENIFVKMPIFITVCKFLLIDNITLPFIPIFFAGKKKSWFLVANPSICK
jgi:hypothetical protein